MTTISNNLNTFRILYLVKGILGILASLFPLAYAFIGVFVGSLDEIRHDMDIPFNPGIIFIIIGGIGFIWLITIGILTIMASNFLDSVKNYNFIFVVAILNCLTGILGILLGIFTIIELNKPHVRELFEQKKAQG